MNEAHSPSGFSANTIFIRSSNPHTPDSLLAQPLMSHCTSHQCSSKLSYNEVPSPSPKTTPLPPSTNIPRYHARVSNTSINLNSTFHSPFHSPFHFHLHPPPNPNSITRRGICCTSANVSVHLDAGDCSTCPHRESSSIEEPVSTSRNLRLIRTSGDYMCG